MARRDQARCTTAFIPWRAALVAFLLPSLSFIALGEPAQGRESLIMGGGYDFAPYEFLDENGQPTGYNVALAEAMAQVLDVDLEIHLTSWNEARYALEMGEVDIIMGMAHSAERESRFAFPQAHDHLEGVIFVRRDTEKVRTVDDLAQAEIIVVHDDILQEWAFDRGLKAQCIVVNTQADALRLLASGRHDCALLSRLPAQYLIRELALTNLTSIEPILLTFPYGPAVRLDNSVLLEKITEALAVLHQTGAYERINEDWLGMYETNDYRMDNLIRTLKITVYLAAALLVLVLVWIWSLRRQVTRRTAALRSEIEERERIAKALQESEMRFRQVSENINDIFWLAEISDPPKMLYLNPAFERISGLSIPALRENPLIWFDAIHPEDREEAMAYYIAIPEKKGHQEKAFRIVRPDGEIRWLHIRSIVVPSPADVPMRIAGVGQDITAQVEATKSLADSETRLRSIAQNAPVDIYELDRDGRAVYANFEMDPVLGRSPLGESIYHWLPEADRGWVAAKIKRVFDEGTRQDFECTGNLPDGTQCTYMVCAAPMERDGLVSGAVVIASDITARTRAQATLAAREAEYRSIVENSQDIIIRFDSEMRLAYASPACRPILGLAPADLTGRHLGELPLLAKHAAACREAITNVGASLETQTCDFSIVLDGQDKTLSCRFFPERNETGELVGVMCTVRDVTVQRDLERRLLQEQKLDSLGVLAGGIAHDFNNIMMIIIGNTEMALDELPPNAPSRAMLAEVDRGARRAAELAHQMLAYSGRSASIFQHIELNAFIKSALPLLRSALPSPAILLTEMGEEPLLVDGDSHQLRQLLLNVVTNACEALHEGRGAVNLRVDRKTCTAATLHSPFAVGAVRPGDYACLEISDNGQGIAPEHYPRLFDPFFTTKFTGRGLGLAAVLGIVRTHHGVVQVDTLPGEGSAFRFYFPLVSEEAPTAVRATDSTPRVLLVDDEDTVLRVATRLLGAAGLHADTADSGEAALARIGEHGHRYGVVILDFSMPDSDGKDVLSRIRALHADLPVILSSGYPEETVRANMENLPFDGFIQKPFRGKDLVDAVRRFVGHSAGDTETGGAS